MFHSIKDIVLCNNPVGYLRRRISGRNQRICEVKLTRGESRMAVVKLWVGRFIGGVSSVPRELIGPRGPRTQPSMDTSNQSLRRAAVVAVEQPAEI